MKQTDFSLNRVNGKNNDERDAISIASENGSDKRKSRIDDALVPINKAHKKVGHCVKVLVACKRKLAELQEHAKALKQKYIAGVENIKASKFNVQQAKETLYKEKVRLGSAEQYYQAAEKAFNEVLEQKDMSRLSTTQQNVSQLCQDLTEAKLKVFEAEATLVKLEHSLSNLRTSRDELQTHEATVKRTEDEFKIARGDLHKARKEETTLIERLMGE